MDRGQLLRRGEPTLQRRRVAGGTPRTDWVAISGDSTAREESHVPSLEAEAWDIGDADYFCLPRRGARARATLCEANESRGYVVERTDFM